MVFIEQPDGAERGGARRPGGARPADRSRRAPTSPVRVRDRGRYAAETPIERLRQADATFRGPQLPTLVGYSTHRQQSDRVEGRSRAGAQVRRGREVKHAESVGRRRPSPEGG
jgi:hypothetical protein